MGKLLHIEVNAKFPTGIAFEVPDSFNGELRGTWWYRKRRGEFVGPFHSETFAQNHLEENEPIEPYQDSHRRWWWTDRNGSERGPYDTMLDTEVDILAYTNGIIA